MIYFVFRNSAKVVLSSVMIETDGVKLDYATADWTVTESNNEFNHTWERVSDIAQQATVLSQLEGKNDVFLPVDRGSHTSPRYSVCIAPTVGSKVSKSFNGDSYPQGEITKVSKSFRRVETSTGCVFYRRKQTSAWVQTGGTFSMIHGHVSELNPSF